MALGNSASKNGPLTYDEIPINDKVRLILLHHKNALPTELIDKEGVDINLRERITTILKNQDQYHQFWHRVAENYRPGHNALYALRKTLEQIANIKLKDNSINHYLRTTRRHSLDNPNQQYVFNKQLKDQFLKELIQSKNFHHKGPAISGYIRENIGPSSFFNQTTKSIPDNVVDTISEQIGWKCPCSR